uniref:uncharacterized protein LOC120889888 n=1 Tax=Ictidomys tridecemlineatus TaxID=43179 RepID=UPI001A9DD26B|nr:uncharacterized protein LOC120889888 [Ictidomys tridecemlineatus]
MLGLPPVFLHLHRRMKAVHHPSSIHHPPIRPPASRRSVASSMCQVWADSAGEWRPEAEPVDSQGTHRLNKHAAERDASLSAGRAAQGGTSLSLSGCSRPQGAAGRNPAETAPRTWPQGTGASRKAGVLPQGVRQLGELQPGHLTAGPLDHCEEKPSRGPCLQQEGREGETVCVWGLWQACPWIHFVSHPAGAGSLQEPHGSLRRNNESGYFRRRNSVSRRVEVGNSRQTQEGGARRQNRGEPRVQPVGTSRYPGEALLPPHTSVDICCPSQADCVPREAHVCALDPGRALLLEPILWTGKLRSGEVRICLPGRCEVKDTAPWPRPHCPPPSLPCVPTRQPEEICTGVSKSCAAPPVSLSH